MFGKNKLDLARDMNPLYNYMDDEEVLTLTYNKYYKDKLNYDNYKEQMTHPLTLEDRNKQALRFYKTKANLTQKDIKDYLLKQEHDRIKVKGEIGFIEGLTENNILKVVPFLGGILEGRENQRLNEINLKAKNRIPLTDEEQDIFEKEVREFKEKAIRGYSIGGQIGAGVVPSLRFMGEFALLKGSIALTTFNPTALYNEYQMRQLEGDLQITDKGEVFFNDIQTKPPLKTLLKSLGSNFVSNLTEHLGGKVVNPIMDKIAPIFNNAAKKAFGDNVVNVVRRMGFDGFIEEVFEEYIEEPLKFALGTTEEDYTIDNFLKTFNMDLDEFLVITGSVAIQGGLSYSGAKLIDVLSKHGLNRNQINTVLKNTTELEKESFLRQIEQIESSNEEKAFNNYLDNLEQQIINANMSEQDAKNEKELLRTIMTNRAIKEGKSRIDIINTYRLEGVRRNREKKENIENDIETFYQSNPEIKNNIDNVLKAYKENKDYKTNIGKLQNWLVEELKKYNINVNENTEHRITTNFLRHVNNRHGKDTETQKDQMPITDKDIEIIPYVINEPDYIQIGTKTNKDKPAVVYVKNISKGITYYVEEYIENNNVLTSKTMYKKRAGVDTTNRGGNYRNTLKAPNFNARDDGSKVIIPNPNKKVNSGNVAPYRSQATTSPQTREGLDGETYHQSINNKLNLDQPIDILDISNSIEGKITKEKIKQKIQELIDKKEPIKTLSEPWMMEILNKKKGHIINGSQYGKLDKNEILKRDKQLLNIDNLIQNSVLIERVNNTKKDKKPDVDEYFYFYTPVKDGKNIYLVKLVAENSKKYNTVNLYDVIVDKEISNPSKSGSYSGHNPTASRGGTANQLLDLTFPDTLTIKQILQNVKDFYGQNAYDAYIAENQDILQQEVKGQIDLGQEGAIITLFDNADHSTLIHETGHYFLRWTEMMANNGSKTSQKELEIIRKFVKNKGEPFTKEQNELFARTFEQYARRGVAPSSDLKLIFEDYRQWLTDIYNKAEELQANLNPDIVEFFDNFILAKNGKGESSSNIGSINSFYQKELETAEIQNKYKKRRQNLEAEAKANSKTPEDVYIKNSQKQISSHSRMAKFKQYLNDKKETLGDTLESSFLLSEDIIRRIGGDKLLSFLKKYEATKQIKANEYNNRLMGFYDNMRYLKENFPEDYYIYDLALKNRDVEKITELAAKYENINLYENYQTLRDTLDELFELELSVGLDVGFIKDYVPRQIKDLDGLLTSLKKQNPEEFNRIQKDLETARKDGKVLSPDDELRVVNNYMAGFRSPIYAKTGGGNNITKERKISKLNEITNEFYETSEKAIANYVARNYDTVLQRQFFGRLDAEQNEIFRKLRMKYRQLKKLQSTKANKIKKNEVIRLETKKKVLEINLENKQKIKDKSEQTIKEIESLQRQIKYLDDSIKFYKKIKAETVKKIRNEDINEQIDKLRQSLDIDNILENSIASYVSQIENISSKDATLLKNTLLYVLNPSTTSGFSKIISNSSYFIALTGILNVIRQFKDLATTFYKNGFFNTIMAEKNIDVKDLGLSENLNEMLGSQEWISRIFKVTGFNKADLFAKNTFLNASLNKTKKLLEKNDATTLKEIELIFGKDAEQVKDDILNNNISFDVKSYLLIKLSETQPIFMSARPLNYLKNGNTRFFYALKTFTLKQLSLYKKDIYDKIAHGKTKQEVVEGLKNLVALQFYIMLVGIPIDLLTSFDDDDWLEPEMISDTVIDNILYYNIINRYVVNKAKTNLGTAASDFLLGVPVVGLLNGISRDLYRMQKGEFEIGNSSLLRSIAPSRDVMKVLKRVEN